jgi:hypothetical protein
LEGGSACRRSGYRCCRVTAHVGPAGHYAPGIPPGQLPSHDFLVHEWVPPEHREFIDSILIGTDTLRPRFIDVAFMDAVKTMEVGMVMAQSFPEPPACQDGAVSASYRSSLTVSKGSLPCHLYC